MQSINQRPSANGGPHRGRRSGVLLRNVVMFLAITAALAVPAVAVAHSHKTKVHQCGNVNHNLAVMTKGKVSCKTAKKVARAWIKGKHAVQGLPLREAHGAGRGGLPGRLQERLQEDPDHSRVGDGWARFCCWCRFSPAWDRQEAIGAAIAPLNGGRHRVREWAHENTLSIHKDNQE